jgi:hypothetical protein
VAPFRKPGKAKGSGRFSTEPGDSRRDALALVVAYVKQETVEPLKALLRFVLFGTLGSFAIALGTVLLLVAALRILQGETGAFHGNLSWLPYLIVSALAAGVIALAVWRITAGPAARRVPPKKTTD